MGISAYPPATQFIDENGSSYGIKHISNKPRMIATPLGYEIAAGNIANHTTIKVSGFDTSFSTTVPIDISPFVGNVPVRDTAAQRWVDSSSVSDSGVAAIDYDSIATGGSATTLVDSGRIFVTDDELNLDDIIFLPGHEAIGIITEITNETTLTCAGGFIDKDGNAVTVVSTDAYKALDASMGGGLLVLVQGLDSSYAEQSEFVLTNGTTAVQTVNSYFRINVFEIVIAGNAAYAVGNITLSHSDGGAPIYSQINAKDVKALQAFYTVPAGKVAYVPSWSAGGYAYDDTKAEFRVVRIALAANVSTLSRLLTDSKIEQDIMIVQSGIQHVKFDIPLKFPARADIRINARAYNTIDLGAITGSFELWLEDA